MKLLGKILFTLVLMINLTYAAQNQIIVGSYIIHDHVRQPIIITNENNTTWKFAQPDNPNLPENAFLTDVTCVNHICSATGAIELHSGSLGDSKKNPFLLLSTNNGKSWSWNQAVYGLPVINDGYTSSISCAEGYCTAVGYYQHSSPALPLLLSSYDNGLTWNHVAIEQIKDLPANSSVILNKVDCTSSMCIASGESVNHKSSPVILTSNDHGKSWSYNKSAPKTISAFDLITLNQIKCHDKTCVAAGSASNGIGATQSLILVSHDSGQSWESKHIKKLTNMEFLFIEDMVYVNGNFVIIGGYYPTKKPTQSLILVSVDNGNSFQLTEKLLNAKIPDTKLNSISCVDNICIAGGNSSYSSTPKGFTLIKSIDSGRSWSLVANTPDTIAFDITRVLCVNNVCTATGQTSTDELSNPLLLLSNNSGNSWSVVNDIPSFPTNIYNIDFSAGAYAD